MDDTNRRAGVHSYAGLHFGTPKILQKSQDPQRLGGRAHGGIQLGFPTRLRNDSLCFRVGADEVASYCNRPPGGRLAGRTTPGPIRVRVNVHHAHRALPMVFPYQPRSAFEIAPDSLQQFPRPSRRSRHHSTAFFYCELDVRAIGLKIVAASCDASVLCRLGGRKLFFVLLFCSCCISPTDGRQVHAWRANFLGVLQTQLLDDQLGVPKVILEFKARNGSSHYAVEDLSLCRLALALANPLGLDCVLLGQNGFHPIKVDRGASTAVIIPVDQCADVSGWVMKHRWMADTAHEPVLHQVIGKCLLPVECCVARAVKTEAQTAEQLRAGLRVLARDLYVEWSRHLGVKVRARDIVDHDLAL